MNRTAQVVVERNKSESVIFIHIMYMYLTYILHNVSYIYRISLYKWSFLFILQSNRKRSNKYNIKRNDSNFIV